jgi:recombination protein RecT
MRTGQYRNINADIVYKGELEKKDKLTGEIHFRDTRESDEVIGYFAHFELLNGFSKTFFIDLESMAKHAKRFGASIKADKNVTVQSLMQMAGKDPVGLGWTGGFDGMALKTALRNLLSNMVICQLRYEHNSLRCTADSMEDRNMRSVKVQAIDVSDLQPAIGEGQPIGAAQQNALLIRGVMVKKTGVRQSAWTIITNSTDSFPGRLKQLNTMVKCGC